MKFIPLPFRAPGFLLLSVLSERSVVFPEHQASDDDEAKTKRKKT